jgi:hypothetical protein
LSHKKIGCLTIAERIGSANFNKNHIKEKRKKNAVQALSIPELA